jgi:DNA-binding SARP family transcriptional activator
MVSLQIQLLGKASIHDRYRAAITIPAKAQELFFYLLLYGGQPQEREALTALLWADISPERAKKYLRQALWQLQSTLENNGESNTSMFLLEGSWILLNLTPTIWLDIDRLQRTFSQVEHVTGQSLAPKQAENVREVIALYRGDLLTGWYQDWCLLERERYQSMFLTLSDKFIDYCMTHQQVAQGIDHAHHLLQFDNARERTHRRLMRLYYLADSRTAALRQFERCRAALAEELGVEPSNRTLDLYRQIQADQVADLWQTSSPPQQPLATPPPSASPVLDELKQIQSRLDALQLDVQTIKKCYEGL